MDSVRLYHRFEDLPEHARKFFHELGQDSDFALTPSWYQHLAATTCNPGQELRIYYLERDEVPSLLLPMLGTSRSNWPWRARRLSALANYYSALTGPLQRGDTGGIAATMHAISRETPRWDTIDLHPLAPDSTVFNELEQALRAGSMTVHRYFCFGNWYLDVGGRNYQTYLAGLPSKLRHTLARKSQHLHLTKRLQMDIILDGPQLESGINNYLAVYQASWKKPEPFPDFISGLIRLCAQQGCLRLGIAKIDGIAAAAQIWIVHNGVAAIYKLAYDTRFSSLSVGTILTAHLMQHVIDIDRVWEVDYLMGDDAYKQDWMSHRRERWGLRACNLRTPRGLLEALRQSATDLSGKLRNSIFNTLLKRQKMLKINIRQYTQTIKFSEKIKLNDMITRLSKKHFFVKNTPLMTNGKEQRKTNLLHRWWT